VTGAGTVEFSNVQARDTMAVRIKTDGTSVTEYIGWTSTSMGALTDWYGRAYMYVAAISNTSWSQARWFEIRSASALAAFIRPNNTPNAHVIELANSAGSIAATGTVAVPGNQWVRIEWHLVHSATVGALECRLWLSPDSSGAQDDTISYSADNTGPSFGNTRVGASTSQTWFPTVTSQSAYLYLDNLVMGATSWPGPAGGGAAQAPARPILQSPKVPVHQSFVL
jgi:hypothetical protein